MYTRSQLKNGWPKYRNKCDNSNSSLNYHNYNNSSFQYRGESFRKCNENNSKKGWPKHRNKCDNSNSLSNYHNSNNSSFQYRGESFMKCNENNSNNEWPKHRNKCDNSNSSFNHHNSNNSPFQYRGKSFRKYNENNSKNGRPKHRNKCDNSNSSFNHHNSLFQYRGKSFRKCNENNSKNEWPKHRNECDNENNSKNEWPKHRYKCDNSNSSFNHHNSNNSSFQYKGKSFRKCNENNSFSKYRIDKRFKRKSQEISKSDYKIPNIDKFLQINSKLSSSHYDDCQSDKLYSNESTFICKSNLILPENVSSSKVSLFLIKEQKNNLQSKSRNIESPKDSKSADKLYASKKLKSKYETISTASLPSKDTRSRINADLNITYPIESKNTKEESSYKINLNEPHLLLECSKPFKSQDLETHDQTKAYFKNLKKVSSDESKISSQRLFLSSNGCKSEDSDLCGHMKLHSMNSQPLRKLIIPPLSPLALKYDESHSQTESSFVEESISLDENHSVVKGKNPLVAYASMQNGEILPYLPTQNNQICKMLPQIQKSPVKSLKEGLSDVSVEDGIIDLEYKDKTNMLKINSLQNNKEIMHLSSPQRCEKLQRNTIKLDDDEISHDKTDLVTEDCESKIIMKSRKNLNSAQSLGEQSLSKNLSKELNENKMQPRVLLKRLLTEEIEMYQYFMHTLSHNKKRKSFDSENGKIQLETADPHLFTDVNTLIAEGCTIVQQMESYDKNGNLIINKLKKLFNKKRELFLKDKSLITKFKIEIKDMLESNVKYSEKFEFELKLKNTVPVRSPTVSICIDTQTCNSQKKGINNIINIKNGQNKSNITNQTTLNNSQNINITQTNFLQNKSDIILDKQSELISNETEDVLIPEVTMDNGTTYSTNDFAITKNDKSSKKRKKKSENLKPFEEKPKRKKSKLRNWWDDFMDFNLTSFNAQNNLAENKDTVKRSKSHGKIEDAKSNEEDVSTEKKGDKDTLQNKLVKSKVSLVSDDSSSQDEDERVTKVLGSRNEPNNSHFSGYNNGGTPLIKEVEINLSKKDEQIEKCFENKLKMNQRNANDKKTTNLLDNIDHLKNRKIKNKKLKLKKSRVDNDAKELQKTERLFLRNMENRNRSKGEKIPKQQMESAEKNDHNKERKRQENTGVCQGKTLKLNKKINCDRNFRSSKDSKKADKNVICITLSDG